MYNTRVSQKIQVDTLVMEFVPATDSVYQWETLFSRMYSKNKSPNINAISLEAEPLAGIPPAVTDLEGRLIVPKEGANVTAPKEAKPPLPEVYKETSVARLSELEEEEEEENLSGSNMRSSSKRSRSRSSSSSSRKKASTKRARSKKRAPARKKQRGTSKKKKRSRSKITN